MQITLQVLPSNKLDCICSIPGQLRLCCHHREASLMDISIIVRKRCCIGNIFCILTEVITGFHRGADTPLCSQVQDIIVVLILCVVKRAFIAKVFGNGIAKVPGITVCVIPANQAVSRAGSRHHIGIIDGSAIGRPEIFGLGFIHYCVIRAQIQFHVVGNADPDSVNPYRSGRHRFCGPVNGMIGIVIVRSK